jgi:hypothetical protein
MSSETDNLLLANLSGGIVGVGDALGALDATNLRMVMRPDGVLVKPDAPLVPLDAMYLADAQGLDRPMEAVTYSDHGSMRTLYLVAYRRKSAPRVSFQPAALGLQGSAYLYNTQTRSGTLLAPGATYTGTVKDFAYYIVAPIGRSGMALLGDLGRFVTMGRQRIATVSDDGRLHVTVTFAPGEQAVILTGYAPRQPIAQASQGRVTAIDYNRAHKLFQIALTPGVHDTTSLVIRFPLTERKSVL